MDRASRSLRVTALLITLITLIAGSQPALGQVVIRGTVVDDQTGTPLPSAHLTAEGTTLGTITNPAGRFSLPLPSLPATLSVRYIGYDTQQVTLGPNDPREVTIRLTPVVLQLGEVLVTGEDFAANLMRKVIARKQQWRARLRAYAAEGYTRLTLEHQGRIVLLSETVYDVYWDPRRGPREVVRSVRQTSDVHHALPVHEAGYVPDFYADEIDLQGLQMIGPTHPEALRYYTFVLADRRVLDDRVVYDLYVSPKDNLHATFVGTISVLDEAYAMLRVDLRPARHVTFPQPIESWRLAYAQQFDLAGDSAWLPVDLLATGTFRTTVDEGRYREVALNQLTRLTGYRVGARLPEAPYGQPARVTVDSASVWQDVLFLQGRDIVPLTPREEAALSRLMDRPMSLQQAFPPERRGGFLARLIRGRTATDAPRLAWPEVLGYQFRFRFNRVDGFLASIGQTLDFSPQLQVQWRLGQASGLSRIRSHLGLRYAWRTHGFVEASYTADAEARQQGSVYGLSLASLPPLLGGTDYFDYYWNQRLRLGFGYAFPRVRAALGVTREVQASVEREIIRSWPFDHAFAPNPAIDDGTRYGLHATLALGEGHELPPPTGLRRAVLWLEQGLGNGSFARYGLTLDARLHTLFRGRPRPGVLDVRLTAAGAAGALPPQRLTALDGSLGPFTGWGGFRSLRARPYEGQRILGVFWQHDFKTVPFEALGLWRLVGMDMGVALYGGHGRTWIDAAGLDTLAFVPRLPNGFHHELGLSLTNAFGTPLHLDLTYRLDQPGVFFGVGLRQDLFAPGTR